MKKTFDYKLFALMMVLLTGVVWIMWAFVPPKNEKQFLNAVSRRVEGRFFNPKKRRSIYATN